jgi:hypothetical protein
MRKVLILFISIYAFAITKTDIYNLYKQKNYEQTCKKGMWILNQNRDDDTFMSIVSLSCVKVDMINTAIRVAKYMIHTPIGRENASYIGALFLTKKLLLQMVFDNIDISNLSLPKTDHVLSIVFENIAHNNFSKVNNLYVVNEKGIKYTLSPIKNQNKFIIKIYKNGNLIRQHIYW